MQRASGSTTKLKVLRVDIVLDKSDPAKMRPGMRFHALPFPFVTLPEAQIREIAVEHFGGLLRACGLPDRLVDQ